MESKAGGSGVTSQSNLSLGLGVAAVITWVVALLFATDNGGNDWLWTVMAVLGLGALVVGLMAGRGKPRGRASIGTVIGVALVLLYLVFALGIVE